jgi:DNA-directed RNA polymerase subunit H (RpoH/RPB5)
VIDRYKNVPNRPRYFIVGYVARGGIQRILPKLQAYNNITFQSPGELFALPSQSLLTPRVRRLSPEEMQLLTGTVAQMGELSVEDPLSKELGLQRGDIIEVHDFSPHTRRIV